jgi:hypothetical protein
VLQHVAEILEGRTIGDVALVNRGPTEELILDPGRLSRHLGGGIDNLLVRERRGRADRRRQGEHGADGRGQRERARPPHDEVIH